MIKIAEAKKASWIKYKDKLKNKIDSLNSENKIEILALEYALQIIENTIEDLEDIIETAKNINSYQESCIRLINNQNK
tara:strand:+ start:15838 stop:16071 length:234 start_codon:yes stop_codon:yes gene_type:complete